jgi:hypothetical protein
MILVALDRLGGKIDVEQTELAELRKYSKDKLPVKKISKLMKRTPGALRSAVSSQIRIDSGEGPNLVGVCWAWRPKRR